MFTDKEWNDIVEAIPVPPDTYFDGAEDREGVELSAMWLVDHFRNHPEYDPYDVLLKTTESGMLLGQLWHEHIHKCLAEKIARDLDRLNSEGKLTVIDASGEGVGEFLDRLGEILGKPPVGPQDNRPFENDHWDEADSP